MKRRKFLTTTALGAGALVLAGCGPSPTLSSPPGAPDGGALPPDAGNTPGGDGGEHLEPDAGMEADAGVTPQCEETEDNILGPFYRPNAPFRTVLGTQADGETLIISGRVMGLGACERLSGALVDVWAADADGAYDNGSPEFRFRGRMETDAFGYYQFQTVLPGRYLNGAEFRPRHIHFRVSAPGHVLLTTQLYFDGDPFIAADPFVHPKLVVPLGPAFDADWRAYFDIVLAQV